MNDLLEDLLELSRLEDTETLDGVTVDIPALLAQLAEQAEDLSQGQHRIIFKVEPGLNLLGATADLKSAFQNLIANAINYTPENGKIKVIWHENEGELVLSVIDSGVGIAYREIPRITERFYRVGDDRNRKTGGTGLGLAIVKHMVQYMGGRLDLRSREGVGTTVTINLPLAPSSDAS